MFLQFKALSILKFTILNLYDLLSDLQKRWTFPNINKVMLEIRKLSDANSEIFFLFLHNNLINIHKFWHLIRNDYGHKFKWGVKIWFLLRINAKQPMNYHQLEQEMRSLLIPQPLPTPNKSKGLTQNFDVKVDERRDKRKNEQTNWRDKNYIPLTVYQWVL